MENSDKRTYQLSLAAEEDLQLIFDYTQQEFGVAQAVLYLEGIEKLLLQLQSNPSQGRNRTEICTGLRSIPYQSHIIFVEFCLTVYGWCGCSMGAEISPLCWKT
jgi:toxin ParE1/3/4